ncbi:MAG: putative glycosyl hydrolase [Candidatus Heimdallarchaeota archaeon LC_3]|nr:MAG: putative glycosyl hydrolase [Candidatus Heimdallarchaeota archaeon LC_3]
MKNWNFDAVIFDLDGVITKTASVHSFAWKKMFDNYLKTREHRFNESFVEFTKENDYLPFVDGKPRYKGVQSFLKSRGIEIPFGNQNDSPDLETTCGLGNKKNQIFLNEIKKGQVEIFWSTVELIKKLKSCAIKIGVASSSKNCKTILKGIKLLDLFDTRVDGIASAEMNLQGKPEPDIFTTACINLNVPFDKAIIIEDAVSGVQAGKNGNFGLVIGVARENNHYDLEKNGADIVVTDLSEISIQTLVKWFKDGLEDDSWTLKYYDYKNEKKEESKIEVLCTIGNGYLGTRGVIEEFNFNYSSYPGTYISGVYNKLESTVSNRIVVNEDLVNCPNWQFFTFKIGNRKFLSFNEQKYTRIERKLQLKNGLLIKEMEIIENDGKITQIVSKRIASMNNCHILAMQYQLTPKNYSGKITLKTSLDGTITNSGVERYKHLNSKHLIPVTQNSERNISFIQVKTNQSNIQIILVSKLIVSQNGKQIEIKNWRNYEQDGKIDSEITLDVTEKSTIKIEKIVSIYTSQDPDILKESSLIDIAKSTACKYYDFDKIVTNSSKIWKNIWDKIDIKIEGDRLIQKLIRLHMYHLFVTASLHNEKLDVGIPARGLHGEAYRGHIFWDTLFIFPFYNMNFYQITKSALKYRYKRLHKAKEYAETYGFKGAMFPWQCGSTGEEETQTLHLNPQSGAWDPDYSSLQRHVSLTIAYNIINYYSWTLDLSFLINFGLEILLEISNFWASKVQLNNSNSYDISEVIGPDEFHEKLPESKKGGLTNNFYTNIMVAWLYNKMDILLKNVDRKTKLRLFTKTNINEKDLEKWKKIKRNLKINISDEGIIEQFEGYFNLKELDWDHYKKKFGNIGRMDRILKSEGKSSDYYKVSKQADTLMPFFLLSLSEIRQLLSSLGFKTSDDILHKNFDYYSKRTSHGSTLSKVVHSHLLNLIGRKNESYDYFIDAIKSDYIDIQGGTTGEGIHTGVMASTTVHTIMNFAGINFKSEIISINPNLPFRWRNIKFGFSYRKVNYKINISKKKIRVHAESSVLDEIEIEIINKKYLVTSKILEIEYM